MPESAITRLSERCRYKGGVFRIVDLGGFTCEEIDQLFASHPNVLPASRVWNGWPRNGANPSLPKVLERLPGRLHQIHRNLRSQNIATPESFDRLPDSHAYARSTIVAPITSRSGYRLTPPSQFCADQPPSAQGSLV